MDGESHNPDSWDDYEDMLGLNYHKLHEAIGDDAFACWQLFTHLVVGWPVYLLTNATGGRRAHGGKPIDGKVSTTSVPARRSSPCTGRRESPRPPSA